MTTKPSKTVSISEGTYLNPHVCPPLDFLPETDQELAWCLSHPMWRICSGSLYKIVIKPEEEEDDKDSLYDDDGYLVDIYGHRLESDEDIELANSGEGLIQPFKPNIQQIELLEHIWYRNLILKARQLGFTTLIAILGTDACVFGPEQYRAAIIAHRLADARKIFRDKVLFAYEHLPYGIQATNPLVTQNAEELVFGRNNASIAVTASARSTTLNFLHISEYGKICAKRPDTAKEIQSGSLPAVAANGTLFIESTAEGATGMFYNMSTTALEKKLSGRTLSKKDYRHFFFPWHENEKYRLVADDIHVSNELNQYFDRLELEFDILLDDEQRNWYVTTLENDCANDLELMWREYPSYPEEAFQSSTEGRWLARQISLAYRESRIGKFPHIRGIRCYTFWDIGAGDGCAVWILQEIRGQFRCVKFIEEWEKPFSYYYNILEDWRKEHDATWGAHYLPHDGNHERQGQDNNNSPKRMLENLGFTHVYIVERIAEFMQGITLLRDFLNQVCIDEDECKEGLVHLKAYSKKFSNRQQRYVDEPEKDDGHSECPDALRQAAQIIMNNKLDRSAGARFKYRNVSGRVI